MPPPLRHAILGAGGIGGLIGACLSHDGSHVTMVIRSESLAHYPDHLRLESPFGDFTTPVSSNSRIPPCDVLWLAVKATQLQSALASLDSPQSVGRIVPLLNGIDHLALLGEKYGAQKVIPATIAVESERVAPGHIVHRSPFCRLNVSSSGRELLTATIDSFQQIGFECRFIDDEPTLMWSKLVFLAPFALSTTTAGQPVGAILNDAGKRQILEACIREACAVASAEGATVEASAVLAAFSRVPADMRSSMQKDVAQGNPPELDAIAGPILRGGIRHNIEVPATRKMVLDIENQSAGPPSP